MMSSSHKNKSGSGSPSMMIRRSISPSGKFYTSTMTSSSPSRSTSPNRITINRPSPTPPSVRFTVTSPHRSSMTSSSPPSKPSWSHGSKKTCLCSPTTHPGSFRCSLHKNSNTSIGSNGINGVYRSHRLHARRSAMTNSLVRIGTVEGDLVKRALAALIRPSSHQQRRRSDFKPRPTRLSNMSKAGE